MEILSKLFSSKTLVKVMRLFLFNPHEMYTISEVEKRTRSTKKAVAYEVKLLKEINFLTSKFARRDVNGRKLKVKTWALNTDFMYLAPLKVLLVNTDLMNNGELEDKLSKIGKLKFIVASGVFMQENDRRVDLLIVGEKIKQARLLSAIKAIESVVGSELRYSVLSPEEFDYRSGIRDRLLRDIFEYPYFLVKGHIKK